MNVTQLIDALRQQNADAEVIVIDPEVGYESPVVEVISRRGGTVVELSVW